MAKYSTPPPLYSKRSLQGSSFPAFISYVSANGNLNFGIFLCRTFFNDWVYSTGDFSGLKLAIFAHFPEVLVTYKRHIPLYIGLFSLQICPDLRGGQKFTWKRRKSANRWKKIHPELKQQSDSPTRQSIFVTKSQVFFRATNMSTRSRPLKRDRIRSTSSPSFSSPEGSKIRYCWIAWNI